MIARIEQLLENNKAFVTSQLQLDPEYFDKLAEGQHPEFLWIGCSDSRVPPDRITGTSPGDMFVHRNIANLVDTQDYFWQELTPLDEPTRLRRLVELNVVEQVYNLGKTNIIQGAWARGGRPYIHGWVFDLASGYIQPQTSMINNNDAIPEVCKFHNGVVGRPARAVAA